MICYFLLLFCFVLLCLFLLLLLLFWGRLLVGFLVWVVLAFVVVVAAAVLVVNLFLFCSFNFSTLFFVYFCCSLHTENCRWGRFTTLLVRKIIVFRIRISKLFNFSTVFHFALLLFLFLFCFLFFWIFVFTFCFFVLLVDFSYYFVIDKNCIGPVGCKYFLRVFNWERVLHVHVCVCVRVRVCVCECW